MADINSRLPTQDQSDGAVAATAPTEAIQVGGAFNTTLPTLSNGQLGALQLDSNARLILSPPSYSFFSPVYTTRLQTASNENSVNGTSISTTITASTSGSLLVVIATANAGTLSISDSASQTYTSAVSFTSGGKIQQTFYKANSAAGVTSITLTSTSSTALTMIVAEYTNVTATPLDKTASGTSTGLTWTSTATTATAQANELLIGGAFDTSHNTSTFTAGTGWVAVNTNANGAGGGGVAFLEEQYVKTTSTYAATGSVSSADTVFATIATFNISSYPSNFVIPGTAATIKATPGALASVTVNSLGTTGATATFYNGSVTVANKIATVDLTNRTGTLTYNVNFTTSLLVVTNTTSGDFTVSYS